MQANARYASFRRLMSFFTSTYLHVVLPTPPLPPTNIHFRDFCSMIFFSVGSNGSTSGASSNSSSNEAAILYVCVCVYTATSSSGGMNPQCCLHGSSDLCVTTCKWRCEMFEIQMLMSYCCKLLYKVIFSFPVWRVFMLY